MSVVVEVDLPPGAGTGRQPGGRAGWSTPTTSTLPSPSCTVATAGLETATISPPAGRRAPRPTSSRPSGRQVVDIDVDDRRSRSPGDDPAHPRRPSRARRRGRSHQHVRWAPGVDEHGRAQVVEDAAASSRHPLRQFERASVDPSLGFPPPPPPPPPPRSEQGVLDSTLPVCAALSASSSPVESPSCTATSFRTTSRPRTSARPAPWSPSWATALAPFHPKLPARAAAPWPAWASSWPSSG